MWEGETAGTAGVFGTVDCACHTLKFSASQCEKPRCSTSMALIPQTAPSSHCARATSDDKNCPGYPVYIPMVLLTGPCAVKSRHSPHFIMAQSLETKVTVSNTSVIQEFDGSLES
jgi:hypothetical protein